MAQYKYYREGNNLIRTGNRDGYWVTDVVLTSSGFGGMENIDWECIDSIFMPVMPEAYRNLLIYHGRYSDITSGQMPNLLNTD